MRIALGASRANILRLVMWRGVVLAGLGILVGAIACAIPRRCLLTIYFTLVHSTAGYFWSRRLCLQEFQWSRRLRLLCGQSTSILYVRCATSEWFRDTLAFL